MKSISTIVAITLFGLLPVAFVHGQGSPKPAAGEKSAAPAGAGKRTDVYHVHFTKAALGKAVQLGDWLKTPDRSKPMPDHFIVLRHRDGDAWDYVVITHLGLKGSVEAAGRAVPPDKRDLSEWHTDTFVNVRHGRNSRAPWALTPIRNPRRRAQLIRSLTIALLPVIESNWRRCSANRWAAEATRPQGMC